MSTYMPATFCPRRMSAALFPLKRSNSSTSRAAVPSRCSIACEDFVVTLIRSGTIIAMSRVTGREISSISCETSRVAVFAAAMASRSISRDEHGRVRSNCRACRAELTGETDHVSAAQNLRREGEAGMFRPPEATGVGMRSRIDRAFQIEEIELAFSPARQCAAARTSPERSRPSARFSSASGGRKTLPELEESNDSSRPCLEYFAPAHRASPRPDSAAARRDLRSADCAAATAPSPNGRAVARNQCRCARFGKIRARPSVAASAISKSCARSASLIGVNRLRSARRNAVDAITRARLPRSGRLRAADPRDNSGCARSVCVVRTLDVFSKPNLPRIPIDSLAAERARRGVRCSARSASETSRWRLRQRRRPWRLSAPAFRRPVRESIRWRVAKRRKIIAGSTPRSKR